VSTASRGQALRHSTAETRRDMEPGAVKRVVFAPAHQSLQRQPSWSDSWARVNPGDFHDVHQLHEALEDARHKVELLERELQLKQTGGEALHQQIQPSWSGGVDPSLGSPQYAPSHSEPLLQAPPNPGHAQLKSTFLLPEMFGSAEFNDHGQVRWIWHALTSCTHMQTILISRGRGMTTCPDAMRAARTRATRWMDVCVVVRWLPQQGRLNHIWPERRGHSKARQWHACERGSRSRQLHAARWRPVAPTAASGRHAPGRSVSALGRRKPTRSPAYAIEWRAWQPNVDTVRVSSIRCAAWDVLEGEEFRSRDKDRVCFALACDVRRLHAGTGGRGKHAANK
jgi:hypothetical protein